MRPTHGSCENPLCAHNAGEHGLLARLRPVLGPAADKVGAYIVGGFALTVEHRHDIRVGVASGEYLKRRGCVSTAARLELLAVLYLCYWRWSTSSLLGHLEAEMPRFERADSAGRAEMLEGAWSAMAADMAEFQVVGDRDRHEVQLVPRVQRHAVKRAASGATFAYDPCMNPSSRRNGEQQFAILLPEVRSGKVRRACEELAGLFRKGRPTFRDTADILQQHEIRLWQSAGATYNRIRWAGRRQKHHPESPRVRPWGWVIMGFSCVGGPTTTTAQGSGKCPVTCPAPRWTSRGKHA